MNEQRRKHTQQLNELRRALQKTTSPYAKRDLQKAIKRKEKELRYYDEVGRWQKG